jgi:hypothetical protein
VTLSFTDGGSFISTLCGVGKCLLGEVDRPLGGSDSGFSSAVFSSAARAQVLIIMSLSNSACFYLLSLY